ncbi:Putative ribonuclease H protein [Arachis hypogaea]|nr:Putative ribonuclease H protein [Arachis hypogaea]
MERLSHPINAGVDHSFWKPIKLNREGLELSHLCFADDLILFAKATMDQAEVINKVLEAFCSSSGQKVSNEKKRAFFSNNMGNNVRSQISSILKFPRTDDLGKYLGVPLLHSKVSKNTYSDIINNITSRLDSCKATSLYLARRTTLVKSVLSSLPSYTMQTALLLVSTSNLVDHQCRNFL